MHGVEQASFSHESVTGNSVSIYMHVINFLDSFFLLFVVATSIALNVWHNDILSNA